MEISGKGLLYFYQQASSLIGNQTNHRTTFCIAYFIVLIVLRCTHEYFSKVLSTYLSTFTKCVLSTYLSTFKTVSTQYLLEYFFLVLASSLNEIYTRWLNSVVFQNQYTTYYNLYIFCMLYSLPFLFKPRMNYETKWNFIATLNP